MSGSRSSFAFSGQGEAVRSPEWVARPTRRVVGNYTLSWYEVVVDRLNELCGLDEGWDGYLGRAVSFSNAHFAMSVIQAVCSQDTPVPQIVPGSSGDLQIEWHLTDVDIEIHIRAANDVVAWRHREGQPEEEHFLTNDFVVVVGWMRDIAECESAVRFAAA